MPANPIECSPITLPPDPENVTRIADLCEQHAYPKRLRELLEALVDGAQQEIPGLEVLAGG